MPEFITLADGSLAVKGRNLLKQSCPLVVGNWINNGGVGMRRHVKWQP